MVTGSAVIMERQRAAAKRRRVFDDMGMNPIRRSMTVHQYPAQVHCSSPVWNAMAPILYPTIAQGRESWGSNQRESSADGA